MNSLKSLTKSTFLALSLLLWAAALPSCSSTLDPFQEPSCKGVDCSGHGECQIQGGKAVCVCEDGYHAEGLACVEDADPCEGIDCSGHGECVVQGGEATCECDPGFHVEGLDCVDDTDPCDGIDCDDQNPCTDDSCDPSTGCVNTNNTIECDDGNACTSDDACSNGMCTGGTMVPDGTSCDDGIFCNGADTCDGNGVCEHAGDPCGDLFCDEFNDVCKDEIWYGLGGSDFGPWHERIGTGNGETMPIGGGISDASNYKECGPDGCLGKCGSCGIGEICSGGQCEPIGTGQGAFCDQQTACETGYDCLSFEPPHGAFCSAQCDPGSGAGCNPPWECLWTDGSTYWCVIPCVVDSKCPGTGVGWDCADVGGAFACLPEGECNPDCTGKVCGWDGCWGSCGSCDIGEVCSGGQCEPMTTGQGALFCDQTDCESGYDCIGHAMYNNGFFCTAQCDAVSGTGCTPPWECILSNPEYSWCGISCNVDSDCPNGGDGWVCVSDVEFGKICLPRGECTPDCDTGFEGSFFPSLIMDSSSNPVVAWQNVVEEVYPTFVKRFDDGLPGGAWVDVGSGSPAVSSFSPSGETEALHQPSLARSDADELFLSSETGAMKYNGSSWDDFPCSDFGQIGRPFHAFIAPNSLVVDDTGHPVISTFHLYEYCNCAHVYRYDGDSWIHLGIERGDFDGMIDTTECLGNSITIDHSGNIVLVLGCNFWPLPMEICVASYDGSGWRELGDGSVSGGGISSTASGDCEMLEGIVCPGCSVNPATAFDLDGNLFVVWSECSCENIPPSEVPAIIEPVDCRHIYAKKYNGNSWVEVGIGSASGLGIDQSDSEAWYPSIAIDSSGRPVVAWEDHSMGEPEIYVKRFDGTNWVEIGTGSASGGGISNSSAGSHTPSIAIGGGRICVAWSEMGLDSEQIVMRCTDE